MGDDRWTAVVADAAGQPGGDAAAAALAVAGSLRTLRSSRRVSCRCTRQTARALVAQITGALLRKSAARHKPAAAWPPISCWWFT